MKFKYAKKYQVKENDKRFSLKKFDPSDTGGIKDRAIAEAETLKLQERLKQLQYTLFAEGKKSLLIVLQALDAGGKDSTIRKVLGPLNPQGVHVTPFKSPTEEELAHDFLWRIHKAVPRKGMIGVFNRSHYEDVLIVRVHGFAPKAVWSKRYEKINQFEQLLADKGTAIVKIFLNVSPEEQFERLVERLDQPYKYWKANPNDFEERKHWDKYMKAFEDVFRKCSKKHAPWYVVPANKKWFRNLVITQILVDTLERMKLKMPAPEFDVEEIRAKYVPADYGKEKYEKKGKGKGKGKGKKKKKKK